MQFDALTYRTLYELLRTPVVIFLTLYSLGWLVAAWYTRKTMKKEHHGYTPSITADRTPDNETY